MIDFIPPQDIQAEMSIISGMVQSEVVFNKACEKLTREHFYKDAHGEIFEQLRKYNSPKDIFVLNKIIESIQNCEFTDFLDIAYSVRGDNEINSIIEMYSRRKIINYCQNAINAALSDFDIKASDISSKVSIEASSIIGGSGKTTYRVGELLSSEFDRIENIMNGGKSGFIQTGLKSIDDIAIISKTDYVIIGARPSNGKSTLAGLIARNVSFSGKTVLSFCLDSTVETEVSRALFTTAKCSLYDCNRGIFPKRDFHKLSIAATELSEVKYFLDESAGITVEQIVARANRVKSENGSLDLIIIDFIQNILCPEYRNPREKTNHISAVLHNLPREIGCPVIALSQLARYENEESIPPTRRLLRESGNLEQDADLIFLLHWPGGYSSYSGNDRTAFRVSVAKQKNGMTGFRTLNFNGSTQEITDRISENYNSEPSAFQNG